MKHLSWLVSSLAVIALISAGLALYLHWPFWPTVLIALCAVLAKAGTRV